MMTTPPPPDARIRIRASGFDLAEVGRDRSGTIYDVTSDAAAARVARDVLDTSRGRAAATISLDAAGAAASARSLAAPIARLVSGFVRGACATVTILDPRGRTIGRLRVATRGALTRALARRGGRMGPRFAGPV
ncbi:MAG TPA: hypothetical protein VND91_04240, partial [Candidatus Saccharimonadia bacterium]|nr:hypothetical protein [Candidatus Saccharimonadia bacterium]